MRDERVTILWVLKILKEYSDEDHILAMSKLMKLINEENGEILDRRTIGGSIKSLIDFGYFRPNLTGKETPQEKEEKMIEFSKFMIKHVIENSNGYFGELTDEELDKILDEDDKKNKLYRV